jgi:hypothetical protein
MKKRRKFRRWDCLIPCRCEGEGFSQTGLIVDLSCGGAAHGSKACQEVGDHIAVMHESSGLKMHEAVNRLIEQGHDPITVVWDGAHAAKKDFWLRMNDLHDHVGRRCRIEEPTKKAKTGWLEPYYYTPQWRKDHAEWLIGDPATVPTDSSFEAFESGAPNYVHAPMQEMLLAIASEAIEKSDIEGVQIDFIRFPYFFPRKTSWAHRHVMTAFVGFAPATAGVEGLRTILWRLLT